MSRESSRDINDNNIAGVADDISASIDATSMRIPQSYRVDQFDAISSGDYFINEPQSIYRLNRLPSAEGHPYEDSIHAFYAELNFMILQAMDLIQPLEVFQTIVRDQSPFRHGQCPNVLIMAAMGEHSQHSAAF